MSGAPCPSPGAGSSARQFPNLSTNSRLLCGRYRSHPLRRPQFKIVTVASGALIAAGLPAMMHRAPEASGFPLLQELVMVNRVLAMPCALLLRPSCNMTVPVSVLVSLFASLAHPTPESPAKTGFARRSPGHLFPVSPIRSAILGLTCQVESRTLLVLAVSEFTDELLRLELLRRRLLVIFYFAAEQSLMCSSAANDVHDRLHLV